MANCFKIILSALSMVWATSSFSQQAAFFDAAQAYNRLLLEKNNGTYTVVNNFKVIGTPYLFGEKHTGSIFGPGQSGKNILLSYNTYNQQVEFYQQSAQNKPLVKEFSEIDSFQINQNYSIGLVEPVKFVNGILIGAKDNGFYQPIVEGPKFSLYKKYNASLGIVTTNYVQSELRQFDLGFDYYYWNASSKEFKKFKNTHYHVRKELKPYFDISQLFDGPSFSANPDEAMTRIFLALNSK